MRALSICLGLLASGCATGIVPRDDLGASRPDGSLDGLTPDLTADRADLPRDLPPASDLPIDHSPTDTPLDLSSPDRAPSEGLPPDLPPALDLPLPIDQGPAPDQPSPVDLPPAVDLPLTPDLRPPADLKPPADQGPPAEICDNHLDDDGDGKVDCVDLADCGSKAPCLNATRTFVVHEVYPGQPDYVVLRNVSAVTRNLLGYELVMNGIGEISFTLPSFAVLPGQTVAICEYASCGVDGISTGGNIPFYDGIDDNAVVLRAPGGAVIDYIGFGTQLLSLPPGVNQVGGPVSYLNYTVATEAHYRAGMQGKNPTFYAADWVTYLKSR